MKEILISLSIIVIKMLITISIFNKINKLDELLRVKVFFLFMSFKFFVLLFITLVITQVKSFYINSLYFFGSLMGFYFLAMFVEIYFLLKQKK